MNKPSSTGGMEAYDRLEKVCRTLLDFKHPVAVPWIFNIRWQLFVVQPLSRASVLRTTLDSDSRVLSNLYSLSIFKILGYPFLVWSCYQTYILTVYRKSTKVPLRSQSLFFQVAKRFTLRRNIKITKIRNYHDYWFFGEFEFFKTFDVKLVIVYLETSIGNMSNSGTRSFTPRFFSRYLFSLGNIAF